MTTDMVVVIADAIDGLKLYLEYIEKVSSNQVQKFFPGSELSSVKSIFQNRINFRLVNFSCKFLLRILELFHECAKISSFENLYH